MLAQNIINNRLLQSISTESFLALAPHLQHVNLDTCFKIATPQQYPEWIYFLESGVASVIGSYNGQLQEIGMIGREGGGCLAILLGRQATPYSIVMQVAGDGYRIATAKLLTIFHDDRDVRAVILAFVRSMLTQISQSAMANTHLRVDQRLARWLLMVRDRSDSDGIAVTHDILGTTLGVARTSVTLALLALVRNELIMTDRGQIQILHRAGLEKVASSLYGLAEAEYRIELRNFRQGT